MFSRQKGLTLVFRNDPLESLKVSSTFDSIPFVRDYLQKEIEGQLRILFMDELPAIIHRLSQRWLVPEYRSGGEGESHHPPGSKPAGDHVLDAFALPPPDPVDVHGNKLNPSEVASLSTEAGMETQSLFANKNLLRLAYLSDSQRTLSLFTPSIPDVAFRALTGPPECREWGGLRSPAIRPSFSRGHSYASSVSTTYTVDRGLAAVRPSLQSFASQGHGVSFGSSSRQAKGHGARRRKRRVVNLRSKPESGGHHPSSLSETQEGASGTDLESVAESTDEAGSSSSVYLGPSAVSRKIGDVDPDPPTPSQSPFATIRANKHANDHSLTAVKSGNANNNNTATHPRPSLSHAFGVSMLDFGTGSPQTSQAEQVVPQHANVERHGISSSFPKAFQRGKEADTPAAGKWPTVAGTDNPQILSSHHSPPQSEKRPATNLISTQSNGEKEDKANTPLPLPEFLRCLTEFVASNHAVGSNSSITEQVWIMKMAKEIARGDFEDRRERQQRQGSTEERNFGERYGGGQGSILKDGDMTIDEDAMEAPPPAYVG